jgi:hypothetical protein
MGRGHQNRILHDALTRPHVDHTQGASSDDSMPTAPAGPAGHLTLQFLAWIGEAPRCYGEAMDAWRTSCPRLSIWEDALREGLIEVRHGGGPMRDATIILTERGRVYLQGRTP